jgi:Flp pilus assembly protein TadB
LHIVGFIAGAFALSAIVVAVAYVAGFSVWAAIGMGIASFVVAQLLYAVWLVGMARAEAQRRKSDTAGTDIAHAKPNRRVAQKG